MMDYLWMDNAVKELHRSGEYGIVEFSWKLFCFFLDNGVKLHNTFKIFSSDKLKIPEDHFNADEELGPPGSEVLLEVITKEVGPDVPLEAKNWGMKIIFGLIVHCAIVKTSSVVCQKIGESYEEFLKQKEPEIKHFALSIKNHLKHYKRSWD